MMYRIAILGLLMTSTCLLVALAAGPQAVADKAQYQDKQAGDKAAPPDNAAAPGKTDMPVVKASTQEELEKQFEQTLSGATLVGRFTMNGRNNDQPLGEDKYTISKVTKLAGDVWLFQARVMYGGKDVTVPLPLQVKWAGDTPVITLTDMALPGLGTYTARVLVFRNQYVGTWSGGGDHGGQMFGKIAKEPAGDAKADAKKSPSK